MPSKVKRRRTNPLGRILGGILAGLLLAPTLSGCGTVVRPQPVETRAPIPVTGPGSAKLHFRGFLLDLQPSDVVLFDEGPSPLPGVPSLCDGLGGELSLIDAARPGNSGILLDRWDREFRDRLEPAGYDIVGDNASFFADRHEALEARYTIGGVVTAMAVVGCPRSLAPRLTLLRGAFTTAEASVTVRWEVMDDLERRVVYRTATRGYARLADYNHRINARALRMAVGSAAQNLAADPDFWRLVTVEAAPPPRVLADPVAPPPAAYAPDGGARRLLAGALPPRTDPPAGDLAPFASATAVVLNGEGHGSGFLVDPAGLMLTNAHVAGRAGQVAVQFVDGPRRIATVLAADLRRDVALLSIDPVPGVAALPIRLDPVRVGDSVAAIGAPQLDFLSGTVSRGAVSALRHFRFPSFGDQAYIQADAPIVGGNSGGPLIDDRGNVVGISVAGFVDPVGGSTHMNLFIPIGEALAVLGLTLPHGAPATIAAGPPPGQG